MAGLLAALLALALGWRRFVSLHLGRQARFNRKRHILLGKIALCAWLTGLAGGVAMVRYFWHGYFITGDHAVIGLIMLPLILWGLLSGMYMERRPAARRLLPLWHGINNLVLIMLAIWQIHEGAKVIEHFIKGG